jgi:hypothetical protein
VKQIDYEHEDAGNEQRVSKFLCAVVVFILIAMGGCTSHPLGPYTSLRIEGQVVAAGSGRPLPGVKVIRGKVRLDSPAGPPKGGELLMVRPTVETGPDGRFALASERVLSVIRGSGWSEVELTFEKPGYFRLQTNFSSTLATNGESGEPLVDVGAVSLQRAKSLGQRTAVRF